MSKYDKVQLKYLFDILANGLDVEVIKKRLEEGKGVCKPSVIELEKLKEFEKLGWCTLIEESDERVRWTINGELRRIYELW
ncbi:hypothetical protein [Pseudomonas sp. PSE14]|uniref:hypothetical protein n=1 Tax=Pseudomonas sp. PSE14 TaxID=3016341 RepID=UPI0023D84CAF|nr:hypothetical protein [Pseudomonas sp. PSE14]WEJ70440.1 hypothetical protein O6P39_17385 [Pseudomonas sp. PSE14]